MSAARRYMARFFGFFLGAACGFGGVLSILRTRLRGLVVAWGFALAQAV